MADVELVKEALSRVYTLYGAQLRSFRRTLYGLIVTGLAIFAVIVVPFLTFRDQLAEMQDQEERQAVARQLAIEQRDAIEMDLERLSAIGKEFREFAERYRT